MKFFRSGTKKQWLWVGCALVSMAGTVIVISTGFFVRYDACFYSGTVHLLIFVFAFLGWYSAVRALDADGQFRLPYARDDDWNGLF